MVGTEGFELSTSSSQSWRSTRLSYAPLVLCNMIVLCVLVSHSTQRAPKASDKKGCLGTLPAHDRLAEKYSCLSGIPAIHGGQKCSCHDRYVARPERFELPTTKFVAWYSIQLSYGRVERGIMRIAQDRVNGRCLLSRLLLVPLAARLQLSFARPHCHAQIRSTPANRVHGTPNTAEFCQPQAFANQAKGSCFYSPESCSPRSLQLQCCRRTRFSAKDPTR